MMMMNSHRFKDFCHQLRFSGNTSHRLKAACYYIVALQPSVTPTEAKRDALQLLLGPDGGSANAGMLLALSSIALVAPEPNVIRSFITETSHTGAPCPALHLFRQQCVPGGGGQSMNWSTVLRLYLAAYCRAPLNKELWCSILLGRGGGGGAMMMLPPNNLLSSSGESFAANTATSTATAAAASATTTPAAIVVVAGQEMMMGGGAHQHTNQGLSAAENEAAVQAFVRGNPLAVADLLDCLLA
jgi:hypothetical protein